MATWLIIGNVFLIIVILAAAVLIIADYRKHKNDESISSEDLKDLRRKYFRLAMFLVVWLLYSHIERFFN